jgi:aldehyde:ferredoxin oxidoreductase
LAIGGGYRPHILRVDLEQGSIDRQPLPDEAILRRYVGGTGLGLYFLLKNAPPQAAATDPDAPLIFAVGPLTGTPAVNSTDWTTVCFNLLVPYSVGIGHGHGFFGAYLKLAGHEGIYLTGVSERPCYLWIDDGHVELRDAGHLWGLDTRETERRLKIELGDETNISVACIGPAGEAQLPGAMVKADRNHGSGKGSPGAVMGSKNLKAIAVHGTGVVPLSDAPAVVDLAADWEESLIAGGQGPAVPLALGVQNGAVTRSGAGARTKAKPAWGSELGRKYVEACRRWRVTSRPSYNCKIDCTYDVEITDGPLSGYVGSPRGGAENTDGICAVIGVDDPAVAVVMTDFFEGMGVESNLFGTVMESMYRAFAEGVLTPEDTDGLDLTWGNWESAMELVRKAVRMEGIGARLVNESKALPETLDGEKGVLEKMGSRLLEIDHEDCLGVDEVRESQYASLFYDTLGVCNFGIKGVPEALRITSESLARTVGWDGFDTVEALQVGERLTNLMRLAYARRGFLKENEFEVSIGRSEPQHPPARTDAYYRQMGWDVGSGRPTAETLARLGMDEFIEDPITR